MTGDDINDLLNRYWSETTGLMRDCSVSELVRGECTSRPYFIFKIDLIGSTRLLAGQRPAIYARIAHSYLSAIDSITQQFGAEPEQTEYHGDSVLALFPERGNSAVEVLTAAIQAHYAVHQLRHMAGIPLRPKVLLHFAPLTVAKVGPWSETHRVAIGLPIHLVAKHEKDITSAAVWLSDAIAAKLVSQIRGQFLERRYVEYTEMEQVPVPSPPLIPLGNLLSGLNPPEQNDYSLGLLGALGALAYNPPPPPPPRYEYRSVTKKAADGFTVKLIPAYRALGLPVQVLGG